MEGKGGVSAGSRGWVVTHDRFRAGYLLMKWGVCTGVGRDAEGVYYLIDGHQGLAEEDLRYRTGNAVVDPLAMRETFRLLEELEKEIAAPDPERHQSYVEVIFGDIP